MYLSRRVAGRAGVASSIRAIGIGLVSIAAAALVQGCSSSRETADTSARLGSDPSAERMAAPPREQWRQPTSFDRDGPYASSPRGVYSGGRDPVTNRAHHDWAPAAPPSSQSAYATPLPPPAYSPPPAYTPPPYQTAAGAPHSAYAAPAAGGSAFSVEVKSGDTLYRIARTHNVTVPSLMQANGLTNESIKVGQRLNIPPR